MKQNKKNFDIFNCHDRAPLLHLQVLALKQEMGEIFKHPEVEDFFILFVCLCAENPAWDEDEVEGGPPDPLVISKAVKYFKDTQAHFLHRQDGHDYSLYLALSQVVRLIGREKDFSDLFDHLPKLMADEKVEKFLFIVGQILALILYFEAKAESSDDEGLNAEEAYLEMPEA